MAQCLEEARDCFKSFISRLLLTNNFIHGRLQGVLYFLSFSGHIPTQQLQPYRVLIVVRKLFPHLQQWDPVSPLFGQWHWRDYVRHCARAYPVPP